MNYEELSKITEIQQTKSVRSDGARGIISRPLVDNVPTSMTVKTDGTSEHRMIVDRSVWNVMRYSRLRDEALKNINHL